WLEQTTHIRQVGGSNPLSATIKQQIIININNMSDYGYTPHIGEPSFPTQSGSESTQTGENDRERERERSSGNEERTALQKAYKVFGLEEEAENSEVIKKYKKLALKYHPKSPRNFSNFTLSVEEKTAKFQEISEAYETINKNLLAKRQENKEKDEIIEELRNLLVKELTSNHHLIASVEEKNKESNLMLAKSIVKIIISILVCCFFYFRHNKEEKENKKIVLALIKYFLLTVIL
ncbi:MAG: hypothetical protein C5B43_01390, partial [Verrucomicrobia bacterium]